MSLKFNSVSNKTYLRGGDLFSGLGDRLLGDDDLLYLLRGDGDRLLGDLRLGDGLLRYLLGDRLLGDRDLRRGEYRLLGDLFTNREHLIFKKKEP